jgi:hypothetical protein
MDKGRLSRADEKKQNGSPSLGAAGLRAELILTRPGGILHAGDWEWVQFHRIDYT